MGPASTAWLVAEHYSYMMDVNGVTHVKRVTHVWVTCDVLTLEIQV